MDAFEPSLDRERQVRLREMVETKGQPIGTGFGSSRFFVFDGKAYCILSPWQCHAVGDYFEFMNKTRAGEILAFKPHHKEAT